MISITAASIETTTATLIAGQSTTAMAISTTVSTLQFVLTEEDLRGDSSLYANYAELPYNPDVVVKKKGDLSIYDKIRRDDQVKAILSLKKFMVMSSGWDIQAFKGLEDEQAEAILEVKENLQNLDEPDFECALLNMLTYLDYGFSITEPVFKVGDNNHWKLKKLKTRAPHTFLEIKTDKFGDVTEIQQETADAPVILDKRKIQHLIYLIHQSDFGNPFGTSDLQAAYNPWFAKSMVMRFWNVYLERFGNPTVVATVPSNMKPTEQDAVDAIMKNFQPKNGIRIPDTVKLDFIKPPASNKEFETAIDKYNAMMSRSMLVPDLIGISGKEITGGSFALGEKQFEMFFLTIEKQRNDLERVVNSKILRILFLTNYGMKEKLPRWILNPLTKSDKNELSKLWIEAIKTKQWTPNEEEVNWLRKQTGFPEGGVNFISQEESPESEESAAFKKKSEKIDFVKLNREKTKFEKVVNFQKVDRELTELNEEGQQLIVPTFQKMGEGIINDMVSKKLIQKQNADGVNKLDVKFKKELQIGLRKMLRNALNAGSASAKEELVKLNAPGIKKFQSELVDLFEESLGETSFYITGVESERILNRSKQIMLTGIERGATAQSVIFDLEKFLEKDYDFTSARVETIVRTNTIKSYNYGRRKQFEAPELKGFVVAYQFSAIIDQRTTKVCDSLDQNIYNVGDPYIERITPPVHFQCRSLLIPITEDESFTVSSKVDLEQFPESKNFVPSV